MLVIYKGFKIDFLVSNRSYTAEYDDKFLVFDGGKHQLSPHGMSFFQNPQHAKRAIDTFIRNSDDGVDWGDMMDKSNEPKYSEIFVRELCHEVINLGMKLRQDQLNGHSDRSGNEVLEKFLKERLADVCEQKDPHNHNETHR